MSILSILGFLVIGGIIFLALKAIRSEYKQIYTTALSNGFSRRSSLKWGFLAGLITFTETFGLIIVLFLGTFFFHIYEGPYEKLIIIVFYALIYFFLAHVLLNSYAKIVDIVLKRD